jgi:serine O-acetyltransferase
MRAIDRLKEEATTYADGAPPNARLLAYLLLLNASFQMNVWYRIGHRMTKRCAGRRIIWIIPKIWQYLQRIIFSSHIAFEAQIGKRFQLLYGINVIIGEHVVIGDDVTIASDVTLGSIMPGLPVIRQPHVGNNVFIGTGAKILGGVTIGDNCKVSANSVVTRSFGPNRLIAGAPANSVRLPGTAPAAPRSAEPDSESGAAR